MKLSERLSLASGFAIMAVIMHGFFLVMVYKMFGRLPGESAITLTTNHVFDLPFTVSRWWDLLIGPVWAFPVTLIVTSGYFKNRMARTNMTFTLVAWVVVSIVAGIYGGMHYGMFIGTTVALVFTAGLHHLNTLYAGLLISLGCGLLIAAKFGFLSGVATVAALAALTVFITVISTAWKALYRLAAATQ